MKAIDQVFQYGLPVCRNAHYAAIAARPHNTSHAAAYRAYISALAAVGHGVAKITD